MDRFSARWLDDILEPKISRSRLGNTSTPHIATYIGDRIAFQNGFGAWVPHVYECDVDVSAERVVDVRVTPGLLP